MKTLTKAIIVLLIIFTSCKKTAEPPIIEEVKVAPVVSSEATKVIMDHHLKAFLEGDIEAFMEDYTDESVLVTPDTLLIGIEPIKGLVSNFMTLFPKDSSTIEVDKLVIEEDMAFLIWKGEAPQVEVPFATDTFIIIDNKIQRQSFAGILNFKE